MGITERKQRHKEDLRNRILEAAKKLFVQQGYEATSIRKIAKEIEFSPTTIYIYYKDKNDIIYALHQEGFNMLREKFSTLMLVENPFERLKAIGKTYIEFGRTNPEFYEVMFMMKEPMDFIGNSCMDDKWEDGEKVFGILEQTITECQTKGYFTNLPVKLVALQAWTAVHGIVSLYISQHLFKLNETLGLNYDMQVVTDQAFQLFSTYLERTK
ncbi:TetR/AcrR family transcriptional regulator [Sphingobacterium sp. MYb382]|uniref:TetR/AcrR family transcriptional regulator n=1 Tax=Sphingobacterium sp. MYb382 TaxID=2745278 RepID=UPI00309C5CC1